MRRMPGWSRPLCLVLVSATLAACGFHLRPGAELPPALQATYIESRSPYQGVARVLRGELKSAGASVVEDPQAATAILQLISERSQQRVLSVGSGGKASEYELFEEVTFALLDGQRQTLLEPQTLSMTRDMVFDETELLGKVAEGEDIRRQMQRRLARQIMTRIEVGMRRP
jgi:LPS-assembly lipoprotein